MRARTAGIAVTVALVGILLAAVSTADGVGLWQAPEWEPAPRQPAPRAPADDAPVAQDEEIRTEDSSDVPRWLELVLTTVLLAGIILGSLAILRNAWQVMPRARLRRRRSRRLDELEVLPDVGAAVVDDADRQRALLLTGAPRNAIVRTWLRLEQTVADAGLPRDPTDTSTEFTERVLGRYAIEPGAIERLAALYREARFSRHVIDEPMRAAAIEALDDVHRTLRAAPARSAPQDERAS